MAFDALWGWDRESKIRVVILGGFGIQANNWELGIKGKNSPGGTQTENPSGVCSQGDNGKGVYKSFLSPTLRSNLVER